MGKRAMSQEPAHVSTVCLNMIVKDEAHVIERCLDSVKALISTWVIVDTGSTDGTQDVIRRCMGDVPGELHERPWQDFATNRNEALAFARGKADYVLVIDADDVLDAPAGFQFGSLTCDGYLLRAYNQGGTFLRPHVFRSDGDFRYKHVIHETLDWGPTATWGIIEALLYRCVGDGGRSKDRGRFLKDAALCEAAIRADPGEVRYLYYLGQSLFLAGDLEGARKAYARRAASGGRQDEVWASLDAVARVLVGLDKSEDEVIAAHLRAHEAAPHRAESLCRLATYCRIKARHELAYLFARAATIIARPDRETVPVEDHIYDWRALDECAMGAFATGRLKEGLEATHKALMSPRLPEAERARIKANMARALQTLGGATPR